MQLVLSGKNIVAYGEGFLAMGGTVINPDTGAVHQNATIVECENCPADLGKVGYEYHAGEFVPCGPFGEGDGNIAVWCDECKAPRDSGLSMAEFRKIYHTTYQGVGSGVCSVTCGFRPKHIIISGFNTYRDEVTFCVMSTDNSRTDGIGYGHTFHSEKSPVEGNLAILGTVQCTANDTGASWEFWGGNSTKKNIIAMNEKPSSGDCCYSITVFG